MRRKGRHPAWWREGLAIGVFLLTVLALIAMCRVRGPGWVIVPMALCLGGSISYRTARRHLFVGAEALLVIAYFVAIVILRVHLDPPDQSLSAVDALAIVGLVILFPAQMALWTGRRTLQEQMLLVLVAVSQFLYGMTLARPVVWTLGVFFVPALIYTMLQYAVAREIEAVEARPRRPGRQVLRMAGLTALLVPLLVVIGGALFFLMPRYSTLSGAFGALSATRDRDESEASSRRGDSRGGARTGPGRGIDLGISGRIRRDPRAVLSVRLRLESHRRELPPLYGGRLYLRSHVNDDCHANGWSCSESHYPRVHRGDEQGVVRLPGLPPRVGCGFRADVSILHPMAGRYLVSSGRPTRAAVDRSLIGHPAEDLRFERRLEAGERYAVSGEMIYAWPQVRDLIRRRGLAAVHEDTELYTYVPPRPRGDEVTALARRWSTNAPQVAERIDAILGRLRAVPFRYTLDLPAVEFAANPTADFLLRSRAGHCERFADALAVLLRRLNIPARVVEGFVGGEWRERPEPGFVFRARDAHAWVEVYFARLGWVAVDPSPQGAGADSSLSPPESVIDGPRQPADDGGALGFAPTEFDGREQLSLYQHLAAVAADVLTWLGLPVILLLVAGLGALVYFFRRMFAAGGGGGEADEPLDAAPAFNPIRALYAALARRGVRPARGETALELARRAEARLRLRLVPVVERLYAARFGGLDFSAHEQATYECWLDELARTPQEPNA